MTTIITMRTRYLEDRFTLSICNGDAFAWISY